MSCGQHNPVPCIAAPERPGGRTPCRPLAQTTSASGSSRSGGGCCDRPTRLSLRHLHAQGTGSPPMAAHSGIGSEYPAPRISRRPMYCDGHPASYDGPSERDATVPHTPRPPTASWTDQMGKPDGESVSIILHSDDSLGRPCRGADNHADPPRGPKSAGIQTVPKPSPPPDPHWYSVRETERASVAASPPASIEEIARG
jgi:hypothetical protein